jgi:hypothetical protein
MAATVAGLAFPFGTVSPPGSYRRVFATVTFDASYPTGGYVVTAALFGLSMLATVDAGCTQLGRIANFNQATSKVQLFSAATTEVANTTDVHLDSIVVEAIGF